MNKIAVIDLETDPFEYGKMIEPFCGGFYDGHTFKPFWSKDCVSRIVEYLNQLEEPHTIFAHNGGRFDFFYFLRYLEKNLQIVNSRIIRAVLGKHELRDSFAIMPFALEKYRKTEIDYQKFRPNVRERNKDEIISYLKDDCTDLFALCTAFIKEFGDKLTIASASMAELKKFSKFATGDQQNDAKLRAPYYFGGRNQVFKSGRINGPIRVYDVNSMYPFVMSAYLHPTSIGRRITTRIESDSCFIVVKGRNYGAFPMRQKDGSLDFTVPFGEFSTTIHEFNAAIETRCFYPLKIIKTYAYKERQTFTEFVEHFYNARMKAEQEKDQIHKLFYKFVLNSAYGKFALNPETYYDWYITNIGELPPEWHQCEKSCDENCRKRWSVAFTQEQHIIWQRPLKSCYYYNIATGASITGAARAELLRGINAAKNPYYCDTDSIICESLSGVKISDTELGAWKLEATGSMAAICGKKLYAIFDEKGVCIKKAHKGAILTGEQILRIADGEMIESCNPVPAFKWDSTYSFTKRQIRRTA